MARYGPLRDAPNPLQRLFGRSVLASAIFFGVVMGAFRQWFEMCLTPLERTPAGGLAAIAAHRRVITATGTSRRIVGGITPRESGDVHVVSDTT
jgi:hypothetical protein